MNGKAHNREFLVLGSSGLVGRHVADLLEKDGRLDVRCATRNPGAGNDVFLDLLDARTFGAALRGVDCVMLLSCPGDEDAYVHAAPFVRAMCRAGVRRVVVLSAIGSETRPSFSLRKVEVLVEQSGLSWTHVRPNFFMQGLARPPAATEIALHGTLSLPLADSAIAYVDARDVAAVLHRALVDETLGGQAITVSGPEALDHAQLARSISIARGKPVAYVPIDEDFARAGLSSRGFGLRRIERVMAFHRLVREGLCSRPDDQIAHLLGRPLRTWREFVAEHRPVWAPKDVP